MLVRLSHLGDVVHALGVFHALHGAYPSAEITWAIQPEFEGLLSGLPGLGRVLRFERRGGLTAWLRLRRELSRLRPDWAVDAQGNTKSAAVTRLSGAPRRVAPHRADWQEPWAAWTASEHAPPAGAAEPHAMRRMEVLAAYLAPGLELPLRTDSGLDASELERGESQLREHLPKDIDAPVLLHLSSPEDVRGWPLARWIELARGLRERGRGVLVLSGPAEADMGGEVRQALATDPGVTHWVGQRGLRDLAAIFTAAGRRGLRLVACDSGPMHLAAAHGLRVLALEGPQDAARTGPWASPGAGPGGFAHTIVRRPGALDCAPCLRSRCALPVGPICMREIMAADVLAALEHVQ